MQQTNKSMKGTRLSSALSDFLPPRPPALSIETPIVTSLRRAGAAAHGRSACAALLSTLRWRLPGSADQTHHLGGHFMDVIENRLGLAVEHREGEQGENTHE